MTVFGYAALKIIVPLSLLLLSVEPWSLSPSLVQFDGRRMLQQQQKNDRKSCRHLLSSQQSSSSMISPTHTSASAIQILLRARASLRSSSSEETQDLLDRARKLREQAQALEQNLNRKPTTSSSTSPKTDSSTSPSSQFLPKAPSEIEDSVWTISYRFSSQPINDDDDNSDGSNKLGGSTTTSKMISSTSQQEEQRRRRTFYSGKFTLKFKRDGYTDVLATTMNVNNGPTSSLSSSSSPISKSRDNDIQIIKAWGWDKETSNEDNKEYLLWSMDILLPSTDPDSPGQRERFYFQARVDDENEKKNNGQPTLEAKSSSSSSKLSLKEGTVTVKKDVAEKTSGWWGVFRIGGILSQFRYTGDFVARPSSAFSDPQQKSA